MKSNPAIGSRNVAASRISIDFDENVQVEDVMTKVVVSPAQKAIPSITANGRRITVDIRDSLIPNTTYTIDFSDAIRDLNEGNVLDGFAIDFSTGDSIDSLRISGMVFAPGQDWKKKEKICRKWPWSSCGKSQIIKFVS